MIRIDTIYRETFWPWIKKNHPSTRMMWCEPIGCPSKENLLTNSLDSKSDTYVFFHDHAPVHSENYNDLFASVKERNRDLIQTRRHVEPGIIVVSEKGSEVAKVCDTHGWLSSYYFFHGWAALDRYRGYNRTHYLLDVEHRDPRKTFMYSDTRDCNTQADCIIDSYQTENFIEVDDSLVYVSAETVFFGQRLYLTEKTFRPIALGMPFVLLSTVGSLEYLRSYGFQSFASVWSEDYDGETDDIARFESVTRLLKDIDALTKLEKKQLWRHCLPIITHNRNWFYGGGFEQTLWRELTDMLKLW